MFTLGGRLKTAQEKADVRVRLAALDVGDPQTRSRPHDEPKRNRVVLRDARPRPRARPHTRRSSSI
jgi:hypothetical protein